MFHLLTTHGTLVFLDETGGLRHGPVGQVPANLVAERRADLIELVHLDGMRHPVARLGADGCGSGDRELTPRRLSERPRAPMRSSFYGDGRFLSAEPDGLVSFTRTMALEQEEFMLLTSAQFDDLRVLLVNRWVTSSARRLLTADEVALLPRFAIRVRQSDHDLEALLAQLRPPGAEPLAERAKVALRTNGWRLDWLHLFRPLAYLTVFGSDEECACALATIGSLLRFGRWPGDILVITDPAHRTLAQLLPAELAARVHVVAVQADDAMDRAFARYRITELAVAERFQPILFLDNGVVCDAPLDGLMIGLAMSDRFHSLPERPLLGADDAFGRTLFLRDGYSEQGNAIGFTTAFFGFRSVRDMGELFATIIACGYGFAEQEQTRDFFTTQDQAFANYVLQKIGVFDLSLIFACMSTPPSATAPGVTKGLLRFVAAEGNASVKLSGMRAYVDYLSMQAASA